MTVRPTLRIGAIPTADELVGFVGDARKAGRRLVVGALITDGEGRVYVQRRSELRALFPGCWDIVGGHVEAGETLLTALAREVREETGWELVRTGAVVEVIDWRGGDGVERRELDLLARVEGDLLNPRLEPGKHSEGRWLERGELSVLLERRHEDDRWVHDTVKRAFELLAQNAQ